MFVPPLSHLFQNDMGCRQWLPPSVSACFLLLFAFPYLCLASEKVTLSVYYESLCPFCANFIVNYLTKVFDKGLISIVDLRMVPWGNAWIKSDGSFLCQHGEDECMLNTVHACTIFSYPDVAKHFSFIRCAETLTLQNKHSEWRNCFQITKLTLPNNCYKNGQGKALEEQYAKETLGLTPPHTFVPWVVVNNQPLKEDYFNFIAYICKAYRGNSVPEACKSGRLDDTDNLKIENPPSNLGCYVPLAKNLTK